MSQFVHSENQIQYHSNFEDFITTPFQGTSNAMCWKRKLVGDFSELVQQFVFSENMLEVDLDELRELRLSAAGNLAREILLNDMYLLQTHGASPVLNVIKNYERDDVYPFFPTDVYSFHVDRSPIPTSTILCTYVGASSEIIPNVEVEQKILVPEIRQELLKLYGGNEAGFDAFLEENFFDLHYQLKPEARPISLGIGHLWRLAVDYPTSEVLPCVHRAPIEKEGEKRLLLIC